MEIIRETITERPYTSRVFEDYFGTCNWCVLDIETTGLSPKYSKCILVGLLFPCGDHWEAVQLFAHSRGEEEELLWTLDRVMMDENPQGKPVDMVVTYNGAHFDLPYLETRCKANRIVPDWMPVRNLDMYLVARNHSPLRSVLPNLKQKSVEMYLGLSDDRTDEISGEESVKLYEEYETFGNPEEREIILLHNRDDIVQLGRVLRLLDKLDLHRIVYCENYRITWQKNNICVQGLLPHAKRDYYGFEEGYSASVRNHGFLEINIPFETKEKYSYVYLPDLPEGMEIDSTERAGEYLILSTPEYIHYREVNQIILNIVNYIRKNYEK